MNYDPRKAIRQAMMIARREVTAPSKASIKGQRHMLAYITPYEAELLMRRGGSGRLTQYGIPAFDDGDGDGDGPGGGDTSNADPGTQSAGAGNEGTGAGPTGAGIGGIGVDSQDDVGGPPGPPGGPNSGFGSSMSQDPEGTPAAANMNTAVSAQQQGYGVGIADTGGVAPTGFGAAPGIAEAFDAYDKGIIGLNQALGYAALSAFSPPGLEFGKVTDEVGNQAVGGRGNIGGAIGGIAGMASGVPGAGTVGGMIGSQVADSLGVPSQTFSLAAGGAVGYADGGDVKGGMDPRSLPGIHLKTNHRFADGGGVQPEEEEGFDAYHGSPHEFEQFQNEKIGTGEGSQNYGYGHYVAEAEPVARGYSERLSGFKGHTYQVRVKANPEHFLDWNAPLSEQNSAIQEFAKNADISHLKSGNRSRVKMERFKNNQEQSHDLLTGRDLMTALMKSYDKHDPETSMQMLSAGIPGIKYFDRDFNRPGFAPEGEGTRNYVIFDPDMIQVKRRYADGGEIMPQRDLGADPTVQQAMDITRQAQADQPSTAGTMQLAQAVTAPGRRRFEIAPARVAPATISDRPRDLPEEGSVTIKRLTDAFSKAISNHLALPPAEQIANARQAENNVAQYVGRGKTGKINSVLTANKKLMKAQTAGEDDSPLTLPDGRTLEMTGLALMPDYREGQFKMCGNSDVCRDLCLGKESGQYRYDPTATQAQMPTTKEQLAAAGGKPRMAAFRRTMAMMRDPESFAVYLHELIDGAKIMAEKRGSHLGVRLNVLSDLSPKIMEPIIKAHPDVSFYDYTKMNYDPVADNHHYTYSSTGLSQPDRGVENPFSNWRKARDRLDQGHNVAMAFAHGKSDAFPEHLHDEETGKKYRVVSGDEHDFRPMDMVPEGEDGVIIALKNMAASNSEYKYQNAAKNSHGFFVHHEPDFLKNNRGTFARDEDGNRISRNKVYTVPVQPMKRGAMRPQEN